VLDDFVVVPLVLHWLVRLLPTQAAFHERR
jgi:hypothetical protein